MLCFSRNNFAYRVSYRARVERPLKDFSERVSKFMFPPPHAVLAFLFDPPAGEWIVVRNEYHCEGEMRICSAATYVSTLGTYCLARDAYLRTRVRSAREGAFVYPETRFHGRRN